MSKHFASAYWEGNLLKGNGSYILKTSNHVGSLKFSTRFEDDKSASSPEELIGAAHASCFSMALSHALDQGGYTPIKVDTEAEVTLSKTDGGFAISEILLKTKAKINNIDNDKFQEFANGAKEGCPVSKALTGTKILLDATLI